MQDAVSAWADGFGVWHVRVPKNHIGTRVLAQKALRAEIEAREAHADPACWERVERVPDLDGQATIVYREGSPT